MLCWTLAILFFRNQVLSSLQPLDYVVVAFFSGTSEVERELLFWACFTIFFLSSYGWYHIFSSWIPGATLPRHDSASFGNELDEHFSGCYGLWCFAHRQWSKVFLCYLVHFFLIYFYCDPFSLSFFSPLDENHVAVLLLCPPQNLLIISIFH